jgi:hypothetical protein
MPTSRLPPCRGFYQALLFLALIIPAHIHALPASPRSTDWAGTAGNDESSGGTLRGSLSLQGQIPNEVDSANSAVVSPYDMAPGQDADASLGVPFTWENTDKPQPIRGSYGATDPGPQTYAYSKLNPDIVAPPISDKGSVENPKWPMELSHNRILPGGAGWARQENTDVLPLASEMAGVDMRLAPGAYRELHWHSVSPAPRLFVAQTH